MGLHSHSFNVSTHLFNFFIANFIAESPQTESKQKGDFIEEWVRMDLMKKDTFKKLIWANVIILLIFIVKFIFYPYALFTASTKVAAARGSGLLSFAFTSKVTP